MIIIRTRIYALPYNTVKLPNAAHTSQGWRIDEIVPDFELEDVWALPTPGRPEEFPLLVEGLAAADPAESLPGLARATVESSLEAR